MVHADPCCGDNDDCDPYDYSKYCEDVHGVTVVAGVLLNVFTIISVIPQIYKFLRHKSTEGVSLTMFGMAMYN